MTTAIAHRHLVALTPTDVPDAQRSLAAWCREKVIALSQDLREQRINLRQAKAAKWKHSSWAGLVTKTKARMIYYTKIRAAVDAGYLVVPNFDCEVMAVRVQREKPLAKEEDSAECSYAKTTPSDSHLQLRFDFLFLRAS
jgi:hypothetical protein